MKPSVLFATLLVASSAMWTSVSANPKGLGPSAREAARLKVRPPANFLAHYLPDDRYKIAGGVWKFVSTDLDTYYHVPQSPNMLRQPASRVIGFANAADAEEAGYVADPTDGTAGAVAAKMPSMDGGGDSLGGRTEEERQYLKTSSAILDESGSSLASLGAKMREAGQQGQSGTGNFTTAAMTLRPLTASYLKQSRNLIARFDRLKPPSSLKRVHTSIRSFLSESRNSVVFLNNMVTTGDISNFGPFIQRLQLAGQSLARGRAELQAFRSGRTSIGSAGATARRAP